jgi:hypothetical protein
MDKCFFYRPRMSRLLRETVARQLRDHVVNVTDEHFRARVRYADRYGERVEGGGQRNAI